MNCRITIIKQKTLEWYRLRHSIITASQVPIILGYCKYTKVNELLIKKRQKWNEDMIVSTEATEWGILYEDVANELYKKVNNCETQDEQPLYIHREYDWLGASPDAIIYENGVPVKLVEYKCPRTRKINDEAPYNYYIQCQIQMEVCDIDECDLFEVEICETIPEVCDGSVIDKYGVKHNYYIVKYKTHTIRRNREWFNSNKDKLKNFYKKINNTSFVLNKSLIRGKPRKHRVKNHSVKKHSVKKHRVKNHSVKKHGVKKHRVKKHCVNKKKVNTEEAEDDEIYYPQRKEEILDHILIQYFTPNPSKNKDFYGKSFKYSFNKNIEKRIFTSFPDIYRNPHFNDLSDIISSCKNTIICNAYFRIENPLVKNSFFGIKVDYLIRNDYFEYIFENKPLTYDCEDYFYIPLFIYNNVIHINKNWVLSQSSSNHKIYSIKAQIILKILNKITNTENKYAYIVGNQYKQKDKFGKNKYFHPFHSCAIVKYNTNIRYQRNSYHFMGLVENSFENHRDSIVKQVIVQTNTNKTKKYVNIYDSIQDNTEDSIQDIIRDNWDLDIYKGVMDEYKLIFIDFETCSSFFEPEYYDEVENWDIGKTVRKSLNVVFQIGLYYVDEFGNTKYKSFLAKTLSNEEEQDIFERFEQYLDDLEILFDKRIKLVFWSNAEVPYLKKYDLYEKYETEDLLLSFKNMDKTKIFNSYSLKNVVKELYKEGCINVNYDESEVQNGLEATVKAKELAFNKISFDENTNMKDIIEYNEIDCRVLYELNDFLQNIK